MCPYPEEMVFVPYLDEDGRINPVPTLRINDEDDSGAPKTKPSPKGRAAKKDVSYYAEGTTIPADRFFCFGRWEGS